MWLSAHLTCFANSDVSTTRISCPLPAGLVSHFASGRPFDQWYVCFLSLQLERCILTAIRSSFFRNSKLFVDAAGKLCGRTTQSPSLGSPSHAFFVGFLFAAEIPVSNVPCLLTPLATDFPALPASPSRSEMIGNLMVYFERDIVYYLSTYQSRDGSRKPYTAEYFAIRYSSLSFSVVGTWGQTFLNFEQSGWQSFAWNSNKTIFSANMTLTRPDFPHSKIIYELVIVTGLPPPQNSDVGGDRIKFSVNMYSTDPHPPLWVLPDLPRRRYEFHLAHARSAREGA